MGHHFRERLDDYLMAQLEPSEKRELEQHLARCRSCESAVAEARATRSYLAWLSPAEATPVPGAGFYLRVQQAIEEKKASGWLTSMMATLHPRFAYPLVLLTLLFSAWALSLEMATVEETIFGIPPPQFSQTIASEQERRESRDLVMMSLVQMDEED